MSKARLVITAVVVEKRSQSEVARYYGVSQPWISRLVARYRAEGEAAFEPRSKRPVSSPSATAPDVVDLVLAIRKDLERLGADAGAHTICWHLKQHHQITVSAATAWRICTRAGLVTAEPKKRPKSSYIRFQAEFPNQMWQSDFTHWQLTGRNGQRVEVEVLNILDDHSRYLIAAVAAHRVTGALVAKTFQEAFSHYGIPASVLTDNGMVFTTRFAGGRRGRHSKNGLETLLAEHRVEQKNSAPNHPQTCGKIERFHQTEKKWLAVRPPAHTPQQLQQQLDALREYYNTRRPHRALRRRTPLSAYQARPKATPSPAFAPPVHDRVRRDRVDDSGVVTLRYNGRLHHIGIGRTHARTHVLLLVQDRDIRVVNEATGELLRDLVLDPTKDYQPRGLPPGPKRTTAEPR
jgi:transposase InsO family protein